VKVSAADPIAPLKRAHKSSSMHREQVLASAVCGCFHCRATFSPSAIDEWTDDDQTALCPKCSIDSVIGDASGEPVGDDLFLLRMRMYWFS